MTMRASEVEGKRVLVAGASGFLGRHLCRRLARLGAKVYAVSRSVQRGEAEGICWRPADMKDMETARAVFGEAQPQIVYQLCGHVDGSRDIRLTLPTLENDLLPTVNGLLISAENPISRFLIIGSLEESDPGKAPTSPYAAAKMASTSYARMFHLLYEVPVVILRLFMTYGPGQSEKKVLSYMIRSLLKGERPKLSSGDRGVDWIYIDDVIDGFIAAATVASVEGSTFELGSGEMVTIRGIARRIVSLMRSEVEPEFGPFQARKAERVRVADLTQTRAKLGWEPRTSLDEGLSLTIDWWRKHI